MFDISWSELFILAVVTLILVGPKDLPRFLNTLGRYAGSVRRQASEFRAQFDEAMREAELTSLRKEVADVNAHIQTATQVAEENTKALAGSAGAPMTKTEPLQETTRGT